VSAVIELSRLSTNLEEAEPGFWLSRTRSPVSYPESGNEWCAGVEEGSFWFRHRSRCVIEMVRRHPPRGPIFDVGGGNGFVTRGLAEAGWETVLIEPGPAGARRAWMGGLRPVVCATLADAGFRRGALAAVGLFDVLEHQPDEAAFLASVSECLAPGGSFYLTVPALPALWSIDDEVAGHHRRYTRRSISRSLTSAGFRVEAVTYIFAVLPLPLLLFRTLPGALGLRTKADIAAAGKEHEVSTRPAGRILDRLLNAELRRIRLGRAMPIGTSCLVAASRLS
jgi:SAM-dependent methyltransferase